MLHGHLPILISRLGAAMRHVTYFYHNATRMIEVAFYSIQNGRRPKNWRRNRPLTSQRRRRRVQRSCLIHYHIFKNAGTSFEWTLREALGKSLHCYDPPLADGIFSSAQIGRYLMDHPGAKAVLTHQTVLPAPRFRGCAIISSILIRDPLSRARSIYAFERQQDAVNAGALKAKELDFKGYVEWRLSCSAGMCCNYQTYFCSRTKGSSPNEVMTEAHLERAIKNLDRINIIGTVERYAQWLALAQSVLREVFPDLNLVTARKNITNPATELSHAAIFGHLVTELGSELAERLLQCNQFDMRLHQVADALLTRHLAERRVDVALLKAYAAVSSRLTSPVTQERAIE